MPELNRQLVQIPIPSGVDQTVTDQLPNVTAWHHAENAISNEVGTIERRRSFVSDSLYVNVTPPINIYDHIDLIKDNLLLTRNKVFAKESSTFEPIHDFIKFSSTETNKIVFDTRPITFDYIETPDHVIVATVEQEKRTHFFGINPTIMIYKISKSNLLLQQKKILGIAYGYTVYTQQINDPIASSEALANKGLALVALSPTLVRLFVIRYDYNTSTPELFFYDIDTINLYLVNSGFLFTNDTLSFTRRYTDTGQPILFGIRVDTGGNEYVLFAWDPVSNTQIGNELPLSLYNGYVPYIIDAIAFNNRYFFLIGDSGLQLYAAPDRYRVLYQVDSSFTTLTASPSNFDIPSFNNAPNMNVLDGYWKQDFCDQSTFSDKLFCGFFYVKNNTLFVCDHNRMFNYVTHHEIDGNNGSRVAKTFNVNLSSCTSEFRRFRTSNHSLHLIETSFNECRLNESETREEYYRANFFCAPSHVDATNDILFVNKLSEYEYLYINNSNEYLLNESNYTSTFYHINFEFRTFAERKNTVDTFLRIRKVKIGAGVDVVTVTKLPTDEVLFNSFGGQVWRTDGVIVRSANSIFPVSRPLVTAMRFRAVVYQKNVYSAYHNTPLSENHFIKPYNQALTYTANQLKSRRCIFPSGIDLSTSGNVTLPINNSFSWLNLTIQFSFGEWEDSAPNSGTTIPVNIYTFDSPLTVAQKVLAKINKDYQPMSDLVINLGDGEVLFLTITGPPDNSNVYFSFDIDDPATYGAASPQPIAFKSGSTLHFNDGTSITKTPSLPTIGNVNSSKVALKLFIRHPGFESTVTEGFYDTSNIKINKPGEFVVYQTKQSGTVFYQSVISLGNPVGGYILVYSYSDVNNVIPILLPQAQLIAAGRLTYLGGYCASSNSMIDTSPPAPDTGGIVLDGPVPPNVTKINRLTDRLALVTNDGFVFLSKTSKSKELYSFPAEFLYDFTAIAGRAIDFLQLYDKYILVTQDSVFAVVGVPFNDTLQGGGFGTPIFLRNLNSTISGNRTTAHLNSSFGLGALIFGNKELLFVDASLNISSIQSEIRSYYELGAPEALGQPIQFNYDDNLVLLWPCKVAVGNVSTLFLIYSVNTRKFLFWNIQETIRSVIPLGNNNVRILSLGLELMRLFRDNLDVGYFGDQAPMVLETSWLSFNTPQDLNRIYRILMLGTYLSNDHIVTIRCYYDYDLTAFSTHVFNSSDISSGRYQLELFPQRQKVQSIKIRIDVFPTNAWPDNNRCAKISSMTFDIGVRQKTYGVNKERKG